MSIPKNFKKPAVANVLLAMAKFGQALKAKLDEKKKKNA